MRSTRDAAFVLDIFRKFHVQPGSQLSVEAILLHSPSAGHARAGLAELVRLGLIVESDDEVQLTTAGYNALWSLG